MSSSHSLVPPVSASPNSPRPEKREEGGKKPQSMDVNFPQERNEKFVEERLVRGILAGNYIVAQRRTTPAGEAIFKGELNRERAGKQTDKKKKSMERHITG